jgi:hypothetical protein
MGRYAAILFVILSGVVCIPSIFAAVVTVVVTVDVTIKAVDARARGITVNYDSKGKQKTIDLDVSRKAEITINGETGKLDSLKPGQKAKVAYEKEFQVVTKIEATGSGTAPGREVVRLTLQLSEFGDGKFRIEKTSQPPADDFEGTPFKLSQWPHTKATKGTDGMYRLVHDFADPDDLGVLGYMKHNLTVDTDAGLAVFTPDPLPEGMSSFPRGANLYYAKKLHLPITIVCDVVKYGGGYFAIHVSDPPRKLGLLQCMLWAKEPSLDDPFNMDVTWHEYGEGGKVNATTLCETKGVTLEQPLEKQFRLPLPNAKITEPFLFDLSKAMGDEPTKVSRLEVRGRLAPMFGMGLDQKSGKVFAKQINHNGLAEKAGFQVGDILSAVNGKKPQTMQEAMEMLSDLPIGEEAVFRVQRGEKTQELRVIAE